MLLIHFRYVEGFSAAGGLLLFTAVISKLYFGILVNIYNMGSDNICSSDNFYLDFRHACVVRVTVVVRVCVCVSVKSHLTSGASVRPENTVTYPAGNEGKKIVGFSLKLLRCRDPALLR